MEKKTVLAVVLSIAVILIYAFIMRLTTPEAPARSAELAQEKPAENSAAAAEGGETGLQLVPAEEGLSVVVEDGVVSAAAAGDAADSAAAAEGGADGSGEAALSGENAEPLEYVTVDTDYFTARLSNSGGDLVSFKLKEHKDGGDPVDMIFRGTEEPHALGIAFGGSAAKVQKAIFKTRRISEHEVEFYRSFSINGKPFMFSKKYKFVPKEYMFQLDITIDGQGAVPPLNFKGAEGAAAYTLSFGPQIGPKFKELNEREDYRRYITWAEGKRKDESVSASRDSVISSKPSWLGIAGKYFTFLAIPDSTRYTYLFSMREEAGLTSASRLYIERPPLSSAKETDTFKFYLGPKASSTLEIYDTNKSYWKDLGSLSLSQAANTSGFWAILNPLEWLLKKLLVMFYALVPNYGVAIILVTLLVKVLLFPLTKKSSEGTMRMQAMAPKIKELQEKYKGNPAKLNAEMGAFYKKEGYNPLSGCLPLLIQIPIFFAMYNLFNNHFDLRGAVFIPHWIPDLSLPEYVYSFAPSKLPFLGWSDLRILPFIYVGSQLLYGKVTQTPGQQGNTQTKMLLYVMPIVFFFVLYNVPSGLLVYWIMSNILTMVQQIGINKYIAKKKAAVSGEESERKVIAPPKKKKRR